MSKVLSFLLVLLTPAMLAIAAPISVVPGSPAGYLYLPAAGGGGLGKEVLAATTCNDSRAFANVVEFTAPGGPIEWTVPAGVTCIRIDVAGAGGAGGGIQSFDGTGPTSAGGNGGDSYVLSSTHENALIALGCGGSGAQPYSFNGSSDNGYGSVTVRRLAPIGGFSGHVSRSGEAGFADHCAVLETCNQGALCTQGAQVCNPPMGGLMQNRGKYPGSEPSVTLSSYCGSGNCWQFGATTGPEGGHGYLDRKHLSVEPGRILRVFIGRGGGAANFGGSGTSYPWYSTTDNPNPVCNSVGKGGAGGAGGTASGRAPIKGGDGANGFVKIRF